MNIFTSQAFAYALAICLAGPSASVFSQTKDEALLAAATADQANVLKTLERLVNIESGSKQFDGLSAIGNLLHNEL
jgi:glutamate carboxypeptidase